MGRKHFTPYTITIPWVLHAFTNSNNQRTSIAGWELRKSYDIQDIFPVWIQLILNVTTPLKTGEEKPNCWNKSNFQRRYNGKRGKILRFPNFTRIFCTWERQKTSRKRPLTLEYNLFSMPELISECWKTRVFLNLLEFTVTENQRKRKKTACKSRNNAQFS